ncbi:enoyl-CoA hydratase/isomerase family protein [Azoarcus taiwanensis]|uniref:Enoyl-CoA hydratase n=1 Tax=Azoarcus taiwanensis TaxID=666964 RepID=A0A972F7K8_9RHOO|nr:enoyl-CoA hydratase-related protein [Azoarcus taiwanensis]NMG02810.1 enoyl-CoA hydratase [Azoarcus taiwanensis]
MDKLLVEDRDRVATLTINRPAVRNALDWETYDALTKALAAAEGDDTVGVIVLQGAGGHFSAGSDLNDFRRPRPAGDSPGMRFLRQLAAMTKPVVAAVEGNAQGVGVTLLLHCDFVVVDPQARFRLPFVALGLCPEGASSYLLPKRVGVRTANDWLLRARPFDAAEALASGLASSLASAGAVREEAHALALELTGLPGDALRLTKKMLRHADEGAIQHAFAYEALHFGECLRNYEVQAGFERFLERRANSKPTEVPR